MKIAAIATILIAVLATTAVFSSPAFATIINVETKILSETLARSALSFSLDNPGFKEVVVPIFYNTEKLSTSANFPVQCKAEKRPYGTDVICDVSNLGRARGTFKVEFETRDFVQKAGDIRIFKQQIAIPVSSEKLQFRVVLPDGTGLAGEKAYLPEDGLNSTDGRNIFVYWQQLQLKKGEMFSTQISYQYFFPDIGLLGLVAPVAMLLGVVAYFVIRRQPAEPIKYILPVLKADEKLVMEKVLAAGGVAHQKHVVRESGYSKAKVSKVLKTLEERGIVRLEKIGRSNKVYLQKEMKGKSKSSLVNNQKPQNNPDDFETIVGNNPEQP